MTTAERLYRAYWRAAWEQDVRHSRLPQWEQLHEDNRALWEAVAIEAEAAAPAALDVDAARRFAKALTEYGTHHGNCPYESWNTAGTRCKCGLFALLRRARAWSQP